MGNWPNLNSTYIQTVDTIAIFFTKNALACCAKDTYIVTNEYFGKNFNLKTH